MSPVSKGPVGTGRGLLSLDERKFWGLMFVLHTLKVIYSQSNSTIDFDWDLAVYSYAGTQCYLWLGPRLPRSKMVQGASAPWRTEAEVVPGPPASLPPSAGVWRGWVWG